ncbi:hypothetical protein ACFV6E_24130 [Streptomyces sp. NPDC059785]|uniref:hypothetical protein n=1 Tax=Streptomyces sp. NPDC059785 TaxID=3346945 RepID=UPI0036476076
MGTVGWVSTVTVLLGGTFLILRHVCGQLVKLSTDLIHVIRAFRKVREELKKKVSKSPTKACPEERRDRAIMAPVDIHADQRVGADESAEVIAVPSQGGTPPPTKADSQQSDEAEVI